MASIFSKLRTFTLGNLQELLDGFNSVVATRERVGQTEAAIKTLEQQIATDTEHSELLLDDDDESNDGDAQRLMEAVVQKHDSIESRHSSGSSRDSSGGGSSGGW